MIRSFAAQGTEDIFDGRNTQAERKTCPQNLWRIAGRKLDLMDAAEALGDLRVPPRNCLEKLAGDRRGEDSIRINDRHRVCFRWTETGPADVEIVDYH